MTAALVELLDKIRILHPPMTLVGDQELCATCTSQGEHERWPCSTLLVVGEFLSGGDRDR